MLFLQDTDFKELQEEHDAKIISKISKFTSNEISLFDLRIPKFEDLPEKMKDQKDSLVNQYLQHLPYYEPHFFSDKIEQKFRKVISENSIPTLLSFFEKQFKFSKWKKSVVFNRLNKSNVYPKLSKLYPEFDRYITNLIESCNLAKESILSNYSESKYVKLALKYEFYFNFCEFQLDILLYKFKHFPLLRREEILSIAKDKIIENVLSEPKLPLVVSQSDELLEELKRLSSILNIEFDIEAQDGQHFSYSCEKIYSEMEIQTIPFESQDNDYQIIKNPEFQDRLNYNYVKNSHIDQKVQFSFDHLVKPNPKGKEEIIKKFNNAAIKELTRDKVYAFLNLQFSRNKKLIHSIANSILSIEKISKQLLDSTPENFFNEHFDIFRTITVAIVSSIKAKSPNPYAIDNESVLEIVLDLYDQFYKSKLSVLNSLLEIHTNTPNLDISTIANKYINLRPDLVGIYNKSCLITFRLTVNILEKVNSAIRTLINLQIYTQKAFASIYGDKFPFFEFPHLETPYQLSNDSFSYSLFDVFPFLRNIIKFLYAFPEILSELTDSLSIRSFEYRGYFEYAIWVQLLNETTMFIPQIEKESYNFNLKASEKVVGVMTSPYLNDLNHILDSIDEPNRKNTYQFIIKLREMIHLGWKLQSLLIKSDLNLNQYQTQIANLKVETTFSNVIDFAYGDYDFSAISSEWTSDELCKIIDAQNNYLTSIEIAVRFNNYHNDIFSIEKVLEMNQVDVGSHYRETELEKSRRILNKNLPSLLFYEPDLINNQLYSNDFCYITAAKEFTDSDYLINLYLPFALRCEITFLSIIERIQVCQYAHYEVYFTSKNQKDTFLDSNQRLKHFFLPSIPQALSLNRKPELLKKVLQFLSIRYHLLKLMGHETYLSNTKGKGIEDVYYCRLMWLSPLFSRINVEIKQATMANDIDFSIDYFNKERKAMCSKHNLVVMDLLDKTISSEEELYDFESVKSYLCDLNVPLSPCHSSMTSQLYTQKYLTQYWHQCNAQFRNDFLNFQSQVEQIISDAIVGSAASEERSAASDFALDSIRFAYLRLGFFYLLNIQIPSQCTFFDSIHNITKEMLLNGKNKFDVDINIKATSSIRFISDHGTIEMHILKAKIKILKNLYADSLHQYQLEITKRDYQTEEEQLDSCFLTHTSVLKPSCYSARIQSITSHNVYLPPLQSIIDQFNEEITYARCRFSRTLCHSVSLASHNENEESTINVDQLTEDIKSLSSLMVEFIDFGKQSLFKTWKGYLQNSLYQLKKMDEVQIDMNVFIKYFIGKYRRNVDFGLVSKLANSYLQLAHLRDSEKVINQEQEHFEKEKAKEYREEFDCLIRDLQAEIVKAKEKFVRAKNRVYLIADNTISKIANDEKYIDNCINGHPSDSSSSHEKEQITPQPAQSPTPSTEQVRHDDSITSSNTLETTEGNNDDSKEPTQKVESNELEKSESSEKIESSEKPENEEMSAFPKVSFNMNDTPSSHESNKINSSQSLSAMPFTEPQNEAITPNLDELLFTAPEKTAPENENEPLQPFPKANKVSQQVKLEAFPSANAAQSLGKQSQPHHARIRSAKSNMFLPSTPLTDSIGLHQGKQKGNSKNEISFKVKEPSKTGISDTYKRKRGAASKAKINPPVKSKQEEEIDRMIQEALQENLEKEKAQKQKKEPQMIQSVTDRIESTKKSIEELQELRKKLRISTTLSALAVKGIYSRMIAKVAEERKNFSASLWQGRRVFEEDMNELNEELKVAYNKLTQAETEIEQLHNDIADIKKDNVKLLHWKEVNIQQVYNIHKELRKVTTNDNINITQLLEKISQRQDELEMLDYEHQLLEEEFYYEVQEPMRKVDQMRKTIKMHKLGLYPFKQDSDITSQVSVESTTLKRASSARRNPRAVQSRGSKTSNDETDSQKLWKYKSVNKMLEEENEDLRKQIAAIENKIAKSQKASIGEIIDQEDPTFRPKSNRTIVRPEKTRKSQKIPRPLSTRY